MKAELWQYLSLVTAFPVLWTPRLRLREWREEDRSPFAVMNADPVVMRHFPATLTEDESNAMFDRIEAQWGNGHGLWAVERVDRGQFIGFIGFSSPRWEAAFTPCVEIGWRLEAGSWNEGFATEGARHALAWGWKHITFPRSEVVSFTTEANSASRRVMEKLGMSRNVIDDFDHPLLPDWSGRRHVLYRLSKDA